MDDVGLPQYLIDQGVLPGIQQIQGDKVVHFAHGSPTAY
jgi:hypothetical protein